MIDAGAEREHLWRRLLDGSLTEVYVLCELGPYTLIPQTLGLEPISARAYRHDRANGEPISVTERVEIARQLAAQRFWIAGGGGMYWDRHFIERAQIALILLPSSPLDRLLRAVRAMPRRSKQKQEPGFIDEVEYDRTQMRFEKRLREFFMYYSPKYSPGTSRPEYYTMLVAKHLLEKHPEKTFVVSDPREIRKLKALRISRDRHQSGS